MYSSKNIIQSKTIIGIVIAIAANIAKRYGYAVDNEEALVADLAMAYGAMLAIYGRIKAVKKIEILPKKEGLK